MKKIGDERALALLAEHAVRRRIGREGIALEGARFVAAELGAYVGQDVTVFPDPSGDMGLVHVFLETRAGREFLCRAVNVERLGLDRSNLAIIARRAQNRYIREKRAEMRKIKNRVKPETVIDAVLAQATTQSRVAASSSVILGEAGNPGSEAPSPSPLPGQGEGLQRILHQTAALAAAGVAVESSYNAALPPEPHDAELMAEGERALHEMDTRSRSPMSESEEWAAEWDRYRALRACADISEVDRAWMIRYEASPEFRAYRRLEERAA